MIDPRKVMTTVVNSRRLSFGEVFAIVPPVKDCFLRFQVFHHSQAVKEA
jgi:hypothetical protein